MINRTQLVMLSVVALMSAFGGFVQWVRKDDSIRTRMELVKTVSTGIFTGILAFVALTTIEMDTMIRYVLAGLASYIGGSLLDMSAQVATKVVERKVGISTGTDTGISAEKLDQIADTVQQVSQPKPPVLPDKVKPQSVPVGSDQPIQNRPGEVSLEAYQALAQEEAQPEKPKRKRSPRKKKATEESSATPIQQVAASPDPTVPVTTSSN